MALYKVLIMPSARKDFRVIPKIDRNRIIKCIDSLVINPRPAGCKKITGQNKYRIRQGDYRIIYEIFDDKLIVWVVKVGHRKDVYRVSEEKEKFTADNPKAKK
jgi:mRNA interferase RelE/StbE